ncbi:hypothetical protein [Mycoplasma struthionis]|uniref:Uncharacterized protein n=1 Tax=Mycoplasma struthionis TaxID=538220 RepID=A0A502M273_9MOLU|nr:hypothetical protein [Mycoplasma struthionis]TPI01571.1 hypothetical protein FJM01_02295 [Mycoplasma struthionis]
MENFVKAHPEFVSENISTKKLNELKKIAPKEFDVNAFLSQRFSKTSNYENVKFLDFKYTNLELGQNDNELLLSYEIYLNYEYASGNYESSKVRKTPQSKYFLKGEQVVKILSQNEKWMPNSEFDKNSDKISKQFADVLLKSVEYKKRTNKDNWFDTDEFRNEIFSIFSKSMEDYNAFPDIYPKDEFKVVPYIDKENPEPIVTWNPVKKLNILSINYRYINKTNENVKSEGRKKQFNILGI